MAIDWLSKVRAVAQTAAGVLQEVARQAEEHQRQRDQSKQADDDANREALARRAARLTGRSPNAAPDGRSSESIRRPEHAAHGPWSMKDDSPASKMARMLEERAAMAVALKDTEDKANAEINRRLEGLQGSDRSKAYSAAAARFWTPVTRLRSEKQLREAQWDKEEAALLRALPASAADFNDLAGFVLAPDGRIRAERYLLAEHKKALRALSPERRGALFDLIDLAQQTLEWGDAPIKLIYHLGREPFSRVGARAEYVRAELLLAGFEVTEHRAISALSLMAGERTALGLRGWATDSYKAKQSIGIIREIERAVKKGLFDLPDQAKQDAATIVALMAEQRHSYKQGGPEKTDIPVMKSLRFLAGTGQQDNFFTRMSKHAAARFPATHYSRPTPDKQRFWDDVLTEAAKLQADIVRYRDGDRKTLNWVNDEIAFKSHFGEPGGHGMLSYGWWHRNTKGDKAFSEYKNNYLNEVLSGEIETPHSVMAPQRAAELRDGAEALTANFVQLHSRDGIPHLNIFAFDGRDPDGSLISHLVSCGDATPNATWVKEADRLIAALGKDAVLSAIRVWIGHIADQPSDDFDKVTFNALRTMAFGLNRLHDFSVPEAGSAEYDLAVRKLALRNLCVESFVFDLKTERYGPDVRETSALAAPFSHNNETVVRGLAFGLSRLPPSEAVPLLETIANKVLCERHGQSYPRCETGGLACLWSLSQIGTRETAEALGRLRRRMVTDTKSIDGSLGARAYVLKASKAKDKKYQGAVDRALAISGEKLGIPADEMQEIAMADWGIGDDGIRVVQLGELMAELRVTSSKKAELRTIDPRGKSTKGISKAFKALEGGAEIAAELEDAVEDIAAILPEARRRLERSWREARSWRFDDWQDRLIGNGLLRTLSERLIWRFVGPDGQEFAAIPRHGRFLDHTGAPCPASAENWTVHLWHPLESNAETVDAWRAYLTQNRIRQPFIQAWRPIYVLTDAELNTRTYSNRFAAHILEQAPAMAMLKSRGWQAFNRTMQGNSAEHERVRVILPHYKVAAEYWVGGVGTRIQDGKAAEAGGELFAFVATDRVTFYALDATTEPIPVSAVPARAFTEIMYDIDTIVGRTSIGNDRHWQDGGANARHPVSENAQFIGYRDRYSAGRASEMANTRRAFIKSILPSMQIADLCTIGDEHLIVDGKLNSYKIHFGSGNILIMPNNRYLCIVPKTGDASARISYVPFEGDDILSIILSKAIMLVEDDKIEDASILRQLQPAKAA